MDEVSLRQEQEAALAALRVLWKQAHGVVAGKVRVLMGHDMGHGGIETRVKITGLNVNTISRGRKELNNEFQDRPTQQVRREGGGRKALEKKARIRTGAATGRVR